MNIAKWLGAKFAHHHLHSEHSPMDAPAGLKKIVEYSKHLGYKSCSITDHGTVSSWVKFDTLCKANELKPIFGIEGYFVPDRRNKEGKRNNHHILLLAKNNQGVKNIFAMSELAWKEGYHHDPRMDWELIEKYHEGVICTSACVSGIVPETLAESGMEAAKVHAKRFKDIFKDDFYVELQYHSLQIEKVYEDMARLAADLDIKVVGTNDVHYIRKEDWSVQEVLMAVKTGRCIKDADRMKHETNQFYLKSPDEMVEIFGGKNAQAVVSTLEILDKCDAKLEYGKVQLPSIDIPKEFDSDTKYLENLAREGMKRLGKEGNPVYEARFIHEMGVIKKLVEKGYRFDRYFLIVADYVRYAWENGIRVGVGRGSGAASLILYCLRITGIDPIKYDLLFERFLTEDRNEMPDIDVDFDFERGHEVFEYVQRKYGLEHCAHIGTIGVYHSASALRAAFRVFDPGGVWEKDQRAKELAKQQQEQSVKKNSKRSAKEEKGSDESFVMAMAMTKLLPRAQNGKGPNEKCTLSKEAADADPDRLYIYDSDNQVDGRTCGPVFRDMRRKYPELFAFAESIEGLIERRGIHAAGILITDKPTILSFPQQYMGTGKDKKFGTAFDMGDVEKLGGIKFDFLNIKPLSVFTRCEKALKEKGLWKWDFDLDHLPDDDAKVLSLFAKGETLAIFQFEGDGITKALKEMKPTRFEDLIAANALYRPGPIENVKTYNNRKNNIEQVSYPCPLAEECLKPTYGIMVYQEQVMKLVMVLAGFNGSESDKVRKAIGKKKKAILDELRSKFTSGAAGRGACSLSIANSLWDSMERFGSYAFNKAHSAGYAYVAYQCAWLKAYFPAEFMAAQLTVEGISGEWDTIELYERGVRGMGLTLLPVDVNKSDIDYTVDFDGKIRRGLCGVKSVGEVAYRDIVKNRPYANMYNYCEKTTDGSKSNVMSALIEAGAFDWVKPDLKKRLCREPSRSDIVKYYEEMSKRASSEKKEAGARKEEKNGMGSIFDDDNFAV